MEVLQVCYQPAGDSELLLADRPWLVLRGDLHAVADERAVGGEGRGHAGQNAALYLLPSAVRAGLAGVLRLPAL